MKVFLVIVPWDYATADAEIFYSREDADAWIDGDVDPKAKPYTVIREVELKPQ